MNSAWRPFTINMIPGVPEVIDAVNHVAGTLTTVLNALAGLVETLAQIVQFMSDALQLAIAALMSIIQQLANAIFDLLNTGIYFYLDKGPFFTGGEPDGLEGFLKRWKDSFNDMGDSTRPQFSPDANVSAMIFLVGANDLPDLMRLLRLLALLFGIPSLDWPSDAQAFDVPELIESGMPTPPDWETVKLSEVMPPFARIGEILLQAIGMLRVTDDFGDMLSALARVIAKKALTLSAISSEIQRIVDAISALIDSSGLYVLQVDAQGILELIETAYEAENIPPWNYEAWCVGVCLLAGTADFSPVVELLGG